MKITLISHPSDAPCCIKILAADGQDLLVQSDWDWPSVARNFGWSMQSLQTKRNLAPHNRCDHDDTDGTTRCEQCGISAGDFIASARRWMDKNDGATVDDPGYFAETATQGQP